MARSSACLMRLPSRAAATRSLAQHPPLHPRGVGAAKIEPRLGIVGRPLASMPRSCAMASIDRRAELVVQVAVERIEQDAPPQSGGGEHVARLGRRRTAGAPELGVDLIEARVEDGDRRRGRAPPRRGRAPAGPVAATAARRRAARVDGRWRCAAVAGDPGRSASGRRREQPWRLPTSRRTPVGRRVM